MNWLIESHVIALPGWLWIVLAALAVIGVLSVLTDAIHDLTDRVIERKFGE